MTHGLSPGEATALPDSGRPTGRRKLTPGQLQALDYGPPQRGGHKRGHVLAVFKKAARLIGASRTEAALIDLLMSRSFDVDWEGGVRPIVWVSNAWIGEHLELERSQVKRLLASAFDRGLLAMRE